MQQATEQGTILAWGIALSTLTPLLIVGIGEIIARLHRQKSTYVRFWQLLRNLLLPTLALFLVARQILQFTGDSAQGRVLETAVWLAIGVVSVTLMQAIGRSSKDDTRLESEIPALVRGLLRVAAIVVPGYYILAVIWGVALNNLFAALGVGSVAIALALQDTLSNLVSGLLLTLDRPFEVGDQITIEGQVGKVLDLNWRSVRVQVNGRDVVTVPNSVLSKTAIYNYTTRDSSYRDSISVGFAYDVAPGRCIRLLEEIAAQSPSVLPSPAPVAILEAFEGKWIRYNLYFYVKEFTGSLPSKIVRSDILSRVYYASQREGLVMPFDMNWMNPPTPPNVESLLKFITQRIHASNVFNTLPDAAIQLIGKSAKIKLYGRNERVILAGKPNQTLYMILSGEVEMLIAQSDLSQLASQLLSSGDLFGEMTLLNNRPSPVTIRTLSDIQVICIPKEAISEVVERYPQFAIEFDHLVDERRSLITLTNQHPDSVLTTVGESTAT
jgi:small-conductance mechanosensitive channel